MQNQNEHERVMFYLCDFVKKLFRVYDFHIEKKYWDDSK